MDINEIAARIEKLARANADIEVPGRVDVVAWVDEYEASVDTLLGDLTDPLEFSKYPGFSLSKPLTRTQAKAVRALIKRG